jgi:hypothetical protein
MLTIQEEDIIQVFIVARHIHDTEAVVEAAEFPRIVIELSCLTVETRQTSRLMLNPIPLRIVRHLPGLSEMTATGN